MIRTILVKLNERYQRNYRTCTRITRDTETGAYDVIKTAMTQEAQPHLQAMADIRCALDASLPNVKVCPCQMKEDGLHFTYIPGKTYIETLTSLCQGDKQIYLDAWRRFLDLLTPQELCDFRLSPAFTELFGNGAPFLGDKACRVCAIDQTPNNLICTEDGQYVLIDYEWALHEPVPIALLQYHAVVSTCLNKPMLTSVTPLNELLSLIEMTASQGAYQTALTHFMTHISDVPTQNGQDLYTSYAKPVTDIRTLINLNQEQARAIDQNLMQITQLNHEIQRLNRELQEAHKALRHVWGSISWKLTKPLRIANRIAHGLVRRGKMIPRKIQSVIAATQKRNQPWIPTCEAPHVRLESAALSMATPNRLVILFFYDQDGVVDNYVQVLLKALKTVGSHLLVVVGGKITPQSHQRLQGVCDELLVRQNRGFDAWSYKAALNHVGWEKLAQYDEVVLTNHTIMGPVSPVETMFAEMAKRDIDFWGISAHPGLDSDPFGCCPYHVIPEHIQSYFLVFRQGMIRSEHFKRFWEKLPMIHDYNEAVGLFEAVLTRWFTEAGFRWDTFLRRPDYDDLTDNPMITLPVEMMRDQHCPFFKRRAFFQDYDYVLRYTAGQTAVQLLDYLQEHTCYDLSLLWENLLRTSHMSDLSEHLHFTRVLPKTFTTAGNLPTTRRIALFMHLYDVTMADEMAGYASMAPENADIYISTTSQEKKQAILEAFAGLPNAVEVHVCPNRGRDVSALLIVFRDTLRRYDYVCVTHDKRTPHLKPLTIGEGFAYNGYQNILASREYVRNLLATFEREPLLGVLYAPQPNHADFATQIGLEWGDNFKTVKALARKLRLSVPMDEAHYPCAPYGSNFWARADALSPLLAVDWTYNDFPKEPFVKTDGTILNAIERIYPYSAQQAGYYSAVAMTDTYSAIELGNLLFYAQAYTHICFDAEIRSDFITVRNILDARLQRQ